MSQTRAQTKAKKSSYNTKNIILIGPRAAGKSKTSRRIHKFLGYQMISTDTLVNYETGKLIPEIIDKKGWSFFRELEFNILKKTSNMKNCVIDCGGGIIVDLDKDDKEIFSKRKAELLRKNSFIIYLTADLEYVYNKIKNDKTRPPLSKQDDFITMMKKRDKHYSKLANMKIDTTNRGSKSIAKELLKKLNKEGFELVRDLSEL